MNLNHAIEDFRRGAAATFRRGLPLEIRYKRVTHPPGKNRFSPKNAFSIVCRHSRMNPKRLIRASHKWGNYLKFDRPLHSKLSLAREGMTQNA
jgi:hypothetical protein